MFKSLSVVLISLSVNIFYYIILAKHVFTSFKHLKQFQKLWSMGTLVRNFLSDLSESIDVPAW